MNRRILTATTFVCAVAAAVVWQGCGGSDHHPGSVTITGNVASVNPAQAKLESRSRLLAAAESIFASRAIAQSSCPVHHLLVCVSNGQGQQPICDSVDSDSCRFTVSFDVVDDFAQGIVAFIDDANQNGKVDTGEGFAFLTNLLAPLCPGTVAVLNDVAIDFATLTASAASVDKAPDTCPATPTPTAGGTATPTATATPMGGHTATPTPLPTLTATAAAIATATAAANATATAAANATATAAATQTGTPYMYGASLNEPPSTMLALLFGAGLFGLILPYRKRSPSR
jgi:hypothetical protein